MTSQPESDAPTARFLILQHERRRRIALGRRAVMLYEKALTPALSRKRERG
jgi:hypothetical protein